MRQLVFLSPNELTWDDVPEPVLEAPGDAIVRPLLVALCDADTAVLDGEVPAPGAPFSIGHEFVAEVIALGPDVEGVREGTLVCVPVQISCGTCDRCRRGATASCSRVTHPAAFGLGPFGGNWPGALADLLRVPFASHMLVPIPDGVDPKRVASAGDNVADAWCAVAPHLDMLPEARVLITGRRSVGLYAVAVAAALGASRVDYVDTDNGRCDLAERLGAKTVAVELGERVGSYEITVDTTYSSAGLRTALSSVGRGGVCTCVYPAFEDVTLSPLALWMQGVRLQIGGANYRAHLPDVLELVASDALHPEAVTSEEIPWDEAHERLLSPSLKPLVVRA